MAGDVGVPAPAVVLTVVVPAYHCAPMLRASLDGLLQSDLPRAAWELIVVDDGRTDDTGAVAALTFRAGCGAIRREVFLRVGGFDAQPSALPPLHALRGGPGLT